MSRSASLIITITQHRGYLDKFVEYLVGDGPANRCLVTAFSVNLDFTVSYQVCVDLPPMPVPQWDGSQRGVRVCGIQVDLPLSKQTVQPKIAHYSFKLSNNGSRCCYCYYWNPARKQRPVAPRWLFHPVFLCVFSTSNTKASWCCNSTSVWGFKRLQWWWQVSILL